MFVVSSLKNVVFCISVVWACLVCLLLCKEEGSSSVSVITERRDMGPVLGVLVYVFVEFWDRDC